MEYLTRKFQEKKILLAGFSDCGGLPRTDNSPFIAVQSCPAGLSSCLFYSNTASTSFFVYASFGLIDNSIRLPALHHFSVIQNQHLIAEALYKCKIMADKYKG